MVSEVLVFSEECPTSRKVKLARTARDLRQSDLDYLATEWAKSQPPHLCVKVGTRHVSFLERGLRVPLRHKLAILAALGLEDAP